MSDLQAREVDDNAHTVFAGGFIEDRTEVNLDLAGALESALEEERGVSARGAVRRDFNKRRVSHTVNLRAPGPSWVEDLLVEEEFATTDDDEDLPMLDSSEFSVAPRVDDLVPGPPIEDLLPPEPTPLVYPVSMVPKASFPTVQPVRVIVGTPIIALHEEKPVRAPKRANSALLWVSAIALWAATMLGAWALRMELFELIVW